MKSRMTQVLYAVLFLLVFLSSARAASAQIRMRGITTTLDQSSDRFLALDLNGDGKSDLLYFRPGGGYADAFLSHGDGTFRQVEYVANGNRYNGFVGDLSDSRDAFAIGDFNGDGKSDFIGYRPGSGYSYLCLSVGDGSVKCDNLSSPSGPVNGFNDRMTQGSERIVTMDLNGDGKSDLIVYAPGGGFAHAYLSNGDGTLTAYTVNGFQQGDFSATGTVIVPLDVNHDGCADLLVSAPQSGGGVLRLYLNHVNNTFTRFDLSDGTANHDGFKDKAGDSNAHLIALDLDGDGNTDFLWWQAGSSVLTGYTSRGDGTFNYVPYQTPNGRQNNFANLTSSTADTAIATTLHGTPGFLWYTPGKGNVVAYYGSASGALTAQTLVGGGTPFYSFGDADLSSNSMALAVNFRGYSDSGAFFWYAPGNSGLLQAYEAINGPGFDLNEYSFTAYPATYLSDLNWSIGDVPLKEVVMLGTHDSAMFDLKGGQTDVSETQFDDLPTQASYGARVFDFRSGYYYDAGQGAFYDLNNKLQIPDTDTPGGTGFYMFGHSNTLTDYDPLYKISQVQGWLMSNPNEVAILDMSNTNVSGSVGDTGKNFADLIRTKTTYPDLLYAPVDACGALTCTSPAVQPQNTTTNHLKSLGKRLILVNVPQSMASVGWQYNIVTVGYCNGNNVASGLSGPISEIECINGGDGAYGGNGSSPALTSVRPNYQAADAATQFMIMKPVLTPFGGTFRSEAGSDESPITIAVKTTYGIYSGGFNNNSDFQYSLTSELSSGAWNIDALNVVYLDAMELDPVENQIIQRNNQTWRNAGFFNNKLPQPAGAISAAPNGDVWAAGAGHSVSLFHYNATNGIWTDVVNSEPNVKKLAADAKGGVWVIEDGQGTAGPLVYYDANGHKTTTGSVDEDVAVGADGSVWAIGEVGNLFNYQAGPTVQPSSVPTQAGAHLAVDNRGYPWVVQSDGTIQRFTGSGWAQVTNAKGKEIAISAEGSVFITGFSQPSVGRLNRDGSGFDFFLMDANHITVDGTGHPWAIRQITGAVYKGALDQM